MQRDERDHQGYEELSWWMISTEMIINNVGQTNAHELSEKNKDVRPLYTKPLTP